MPLRVGSLFSGIGGIDLGLERAGMRVVWQVENDPYAQAVLRKHWPSAGLHGDAREVGATNLEPVDLVCGGFPCQDISLIGQGGGVEKGEKSGLWREFARIVCELRPRYVLVENVSALKRRGLDLVLGDLAALGYDAEWDCIPASAVGAPHRRDRIFIVAHAQRYGLERIFPEGTEARATLRSGPWEAEPAVCRVADGVPSLMDRTRCLGNAVVPQVAEWIGRQILARS